MEHFASFKSYCRFAMAREFVHKETGSPFIYAKKRLEKIGDLLASPLIKPGDFVLKNIRNPLFVTAAVIIGLALTTLLFYPAIIPSLVLFTFTVKAGIFLLCQSTILGIGLRTLGRLGHPELMSAWDRQKLAPVPIGAILIRT